jgi:hypothetical protein
MSEARFRERSIGQYVTMIGGKAGRIVDVTSAGYMVELTDGERRTMQGSSFTQINSKPIVTDIRAEARAALDVMDRIRRGEHVDVAEIVRDAAISRNASGTSPERIAAALEGGRAALANRPGSRPPTKAEKFAEFQAGVRDQFERLPKG